MISIAEIWRFPVKSLRGERVREASVEPRGLRGDRRYMLVDEQGRFVSMRSVPSLTHIRATGLEGTVALHAAGQQFQVVKPDASAATRMVQVWGDDVVARDVGDEAAAWLSERAGHSVRLVYMADDAERPVNPDFSREGDIVSFADGYPVLLATNASLSDLNQRIVGRGGKSITMERFRPNIVISGGEAFAEDGWTQLRIGGVDFDVVKPCDRCSVPTVDPDTAETSKEPTATLATFRAGNGRVYFGMNAIPRSSGEISVGDAVEIL